jgi:hypothetical protein
MSEIFGHFGMPPDAAAKCACGLAAIILLAHRRLSRTFYKLPSAQANAGIKGLALCAAVASIIYYYYCLRGGPRIIDATYYWLQAKTFANGHLTLPLLHPTAAQRGRFLYYNLEHSRLSVLFPPGYAAILSFGMLLKVPELVGPCIAAGLVLATAALARRIFGDYRIALAAALLSVLCACLRYHTADTLSHGWAALLFTMSVWGALGVSRRDIVCSGLCAGWLIATRPVTAIALLLIVAILLRKISRKNWFSFATALLPGIAAWLVYQRVTTGFWLSSTQLAYYGLSDGPPGCFRYGFGQGIGCHFEHGRYVAKRLPSGYTPLAALVVSGVRLRWHLLDVLNFEPLALILIVAARRLRAFGATKVLIWTPLLLLVAYAPFYFDGNFPGGGARLLSEAIPIEHVLLSGWLIQQGGLIAVVVCSLLGYGMHGAFEHRKLQNREGGHPMFDSNFPKEAGITRGLILVDTDHGFALGHQPGQSDTNRGIVVARTHYDAHDWLLWKNLGSPPAYRYIYDVRQKEATPRLEAITFPEITKLRFEAEAEWPVLALKDAWAIPGYPPTDCVSKRRALIMHPSGRQPTVTIALPVPHAGRFRVGIGWVAYTNSPTTITAALGAVTWQTSVESLRFQCGQSLGPPTELSEGEAPLRLQFQGDVLGLDWVELSPAL